QPLHILTAREARPSGRLFCALLVSIRHIDHHQEHRWSLAMTSEHDVPPLLLPGSLLNRLYILSANDHAIVHIDRRRFLAAAHGIAPQLRSSTSSRAASGRRKVGGQPSTSVCEQRPQAVRSERWWCCLRVGPSGPVNRRSDGRAEDPTISGGRSE